MGVSSLRRSITVRVTAISRCRGPSRRNPRWPYRLDSRMLIANLCEIQKRVQVAGRPAHQAQRRGLHYFVIDERGLKLLGRDLEPE